MTTNTKKKKSAREKRVLVASLIVAAVMIGGSTFAWFTSKDEVTNRLSASADYDVAISENFQPPEEWVPGQEINKDAGATNTGNVDAFVRMWLDGEMTVVSEGDGAALTTDLSTAAAATNSSLANMNLYYLAAAPNTYYKKLDINKTKNPNNSNTNPNEGNTTNANNNSGAYSEVQAMQAGGILAYAPDGAKYSYVTNQPTELTILTSASTSATLTVPAGVTVNAGGTTYVTPDVTTGQLPAGTTAVSVAAWNGTPVYVDAESFVPDASSVGLYLFARNSNMNDTDATAAATYEFSGYQFDGTDYWALKNDPTNNTSDYTLPSATVTATVSQGKLTGATLGTGDNAPKLYTATKNVLAADALTWTYTEDATDGAYLHALRDITATGNTAGTLNDGEIMIDIKLANIKGVGGVTEASESWTAIKDNATTPTNLTTFYYNNDVESGDSTVKLVDSVILNKDVTKNAYLAFDFDLNVHLESIQVTMDENGNELTTAVEKWKATNVTPAVNTGSNATQQKTGEIKEIAWGAYSE